MELDIQYTDEELEQSLGSQYEIEENQNHMKVHIPQLQFQKQVTNQLNEMRNNQQFPIFEKNLHSLQDLEQSNKIMIQEHLLSNMNESMFSITDTQDISYQLRNENTNRLPSITTNKYTHTSFSNQSKMASSQEAGSLNEQLSIMKSQMMRVQQDTNELQKNLNSSKPILVHDYLQSKREPSVQNSHQKTVKGFEMDDISPLKQKKKKSSNMKEQEQDIQLMSDQYESQKSELHQILENKNQQLRNQKEIYSKLKQGFEASIMEVKQMQLQITQAQREKQDLNQRLQVLHKKDNDLKALNEDNRRLQIQVEKLSAQNEFFSQFDINYYKEQVQNKDNEIQSEKERYNYQQDRLQNLTTEINCLVLNGIIKKESIVRDKDQHILSFESTHKTEKSKLEQKIKYYENIIKNMQRTTGSQYQQNLNDISNDQSLNHYQQSNQSSNHIMPNQISNQDQREALRCLIEVLEAKDNKILQLSNEIKHLNDPIHYRQNPDNSIRAQSQENDFQRDQFGIVSMNHSHFYEQNNIPRHRKVASTNNDPSIRASILNYDLPVKLLQCLKQ